MAIVRQWVGPQTILLVAQKIAAIVDEHQNQHQGRDRRVLLEPLGAEIGGMLAQLDEGDEWVLTPLVDMLERIADRYFTSEENRERFLREVVGLVIDREAAPDKPVMSSRQLGRQQVLRAQPGRETAEERATRAEADPTFALARKQVERAQPEMPADTEGSR